MAGAEVRGHSHEDPEGRGHLELHFSPQYPEKNRKKNLGH